MNVRLVPALGAVLFAIPLHVPVLAQEVAAAAGADRWQVRRLMQPAPAELAREAKGEVFIYENLKDTEVKAALDANFDRIEHMMFIGTVKTDERGEVQKDPSTSAPVLEDNGGC
ncbi:MAG: hypothetical protein MUF66_09790 [Gammaproteobacteria bacterium]|jgi:hypothetical protein|nr:hypothetical protein [Gammaproteobacteria bacterium]